MTNTKTTPEKNPGGMTDEQRARWKETRLFPVELWGQSPGATPLVCPLPDRALLRKIAESIPAHVLGSGWYASRSYSGFQSVYGENFSGMGRQAIADIPSNRHYFGWLPEYIAAAHPRTMLSLLDYIAELERRLAIKTAEPVPPQVSKET